MVKHASVAVVGGGVVGASVAYHLAKRGVRDIVIFDRTDAPGNGSTGCATGLFRAQFASRANVALSLVSREKLRALRDETGIDSGYVPAGHLWIASSERTMELLRNALAVQHSAGLDEAEEIAARDVARLNPAIVANDAIGGAWCHTDGYIRPMDILRAYLGAADRLGVKAEWGVDVCEIIFGKDFRASEISTSEGNVSVDCVVNAAGPWAGALRCGARLGVPVHPAKRQAALSERHHALPDQMPMTIFADTGFQVGVHDGRMILLGPSPSDANPFDLTIDNEWLSSVRAEGARRLPKLANLEIDAAKCMAGLYDMSPDGHAILGPAPWCENVFLANGSSGHGVMHAPALGQLLSEIICDGVASSIDVSPLRPTRFSERALNESLELL
jgi:sarcosine oxidase subunit beta